MQIRDLLVLKIPTWNLMLDITVPNVYINLECILYRQKSDRI